MNTKPDTEVMLALADDLRQQLDHLAAPDAVTVLVMATARVLARRFSLTTCVAIIPTLQDILATGAIVEARAAGADRRRGGVPL